MEVNAALIKNLRIERHWTQQHLADACAISLRTVQRVERYGNASQETLMSLASVFEVNQTELLAITECLTEIKQVIKIDKARERQLIFAGIAIGSLFGASIMYFMSLLT